MSIESTYRTMDDLVKFEIRHSLSTSGVKHLVHIHKQKLRNELAGLGGLSDDKLLARYKELNAHIALWTDFESFIKELTNQLERNL